ncbi:MAG: hypothetical protein ACK2UO_09100 [Caldilineaceae bacterium]
MLIVLDSMEGASLRAWQMRRSTPAAAIRAGHKPVSPAVLEKENGLYDSGRGAAISYLIVAA